MKCSFKFDYSRNLVRIGTTAYLEPEELDINEKYKGQGQLLGRIDKKRNSFVIVSAQQVKWQTATEEEREELMKEDCENCYKKDGEQALPPIQMLEPMYLVARSIINRGEKQDCVLKVHDIIKFGRVRFKIQELNVSIVTQKQ